MSAPILLCTDLDRTLLPNGAAPESPDARPLFRRLAEHPEVNLAYVTGRNLMLVMEAIQRFELPKPRYAIADVGTTIWEWKQGAWSVWPEWRNEIRHDWNGRTPQDLHERLADLAELELQHESKQGELKLSYDTPIDVDFDELRKEIMRRLDPLGVRCRMVWSIDELAGCGLLDILPSSAGKLHAVEFLARRRGFTHERTIYAGDSGNDMVVLVSNVPSILVANASEEVRAQAHELAVSRGHESSLYIAQGGFLGMNGNYGAGILEGLAHYLPETESWMK